MKKFTKEISALLVTVTAGTIAGGGVNALETAEQPLTGDIAPSSSCDITAVSYTHLTLPTKA